MLKLQSLTIERATDFLSNIQEVLKIYNHLFYSFSIVLLKRA